MNAHLRPIPEAPLTPAERVQKLIDAITAYEVRRRAVEEFADEIGFAEVLSISRPDQQRLDELVDREIRAQEEVVATLKTLMAGGLLERCADILRIETAGRP